ncbi:universal stress protein [Pontibacter harenae]|uniref:universal stress protein n=1 Tax=Pontibacter harenae TaxID=2894083 RepID=UPI001E4F5418|nr:universal stress protein [Pontibacter harenae]MCC9168399.1 universal stress protein [Pontibacter harenae]
MKRILVPTDFSEQAQYALEVAVNIARKTGATIKLLHVVEIPYGTNFSATGDITTTAPNTMDHVFTLKLIERTKAQMQELKNSAYLDGINVVEEVDVATLTSKVKLTIEEDAVDLVVMGSKGASGLSEFLVGSNTEKVVRTASCPVLTVKEKPGAFEVKDIVLASDFKREISQATEKFKAFQELFNAKLHLVYINTPGAFESTGNVKKKLESFASNAGFQNYTSNVYNDVVEEDGILHFAHDINADLIMMATHGRTGLAHLLSGSIAEDLVNHTSIPVLTLHIK